MVTTVASSVKKPMTDLENTIRKTPKTDIKEAANFMAVQPDFSAPVGFPAPRFCPTRVVARSEEHTSELQSPTNLVCRLLLDKKKIQKNNRTKTPTHKAQKYKRKKVPQS